MTPFIGCFHNNQFHHSNQPLVIASESLADPGVPEVLKETSESMDVTGGGGRVREGGRAGGREGS